MVHKHGPHWRTSSKEVECAKCIPCLQGLPSDESFSKHVSEQVEEVKSEVKQLVLDSVNDGCRIALAVDDWKTKANLPRHFSAAFLSWISKEWESKEVCVDTAELSRKDVGSRADIFKKALAAVCLEVGSLVAGGTDHEGAVRKHLDAFCGCHCVQLLLKRCVQKNNSRKARSVAARSGAEFLKSFV